MKVILFIGHHKVGSTALQTFLAQNSVSLLRAGILYPSVDFQGCAVNMSRLLRGENDSEPLPINAREPHNALAFRMIADQRKRGIPKWHAGVPATAQMLRAIKMQIRYLKPEAVILAAEVFSNFAVEAPSAITQLAEIFEGDEVSIMATLRRVDDYLVSWHGQRLKFGQKISPLRNTATRDYISSVHFDYQLMLGKWFEEFPNADFVIRNYRDVLKSGGACEDFMAQSGLTFPRGLATVAAANPSLHPALHEIARIGNKELTPDDAISLINFLISFQPKLKLPDPRSIEMFGAENRKLMTKEFTRVHDYLCDKNKSDTFFPDIAEVSKARKISELDAANKALAKIQSNINRSSLLGKLMPNSEVEIASEAKNFLMNINISNY